ncbi:hypothetical protein ACH5RR_006583 [Cinchona calisaya]|uniref:Uncharacterized protein n=1 Tax=Cinchona calisaya TaxID=153742 RepID=A0ABD3APE1_9GENT
MLLSRCNNKADNLLLTRRSVNYASDDQALKLGNDESNPNDVQHVGVQESSPLLFNVGSIEDPILPSLMLGAADFGRLGPSLHETRSMHVNKLPTGEVVDTGVKELESSETKGEIFLVHVALSKGHLKAVAPEARNGVGAKGSKRGGWKRKPKEGLRLDIGSEKFLSTRGKSKLVIDKFKNKIKSFGVAVNAYDRTGCLGLLWKKYLSVSLLGFNSGFIDVMLRNLGSVCTGVVQGLEFWGSLPCPQWQIDCFGEAVTFCELHDIGFSGIRGRAFVIPCLYHLPITLKLRSRKTERLMKQMESIIRHGVDKSNAQELGHIESQLELLLGRKI